ncbi:patatin-like phospholipase family protein [Mycoplasmatota bacterium]|nr:patatin-like phospholipase family protein [Mycoplasmatota bacterium]
MKVDAFFEGGGILGISFIGAYKALTDHGIYIDKAIGISCGAILATLITAGFSANELITLLNVYKDFSFLKQKTQTSKRNYIGKPLSLLLNKGIYDSYIIEKFIDKTLKQKKISTFGDVMSLGESKLKMIAADFTNKRMLLLPDDLPLYGYDPMEFKIAKAIRMSCAIPFFYTPYELKSTHKSNYIIDGGVIRNIPTSVINKNQELSKLTLRFKIKGSRNKWFNSFKDIQNTLKYNKDNTSYEKHIIINTDGRLKITDFEVSREQIIYLYREGYKAVYQFIKHELL